MIWDHIIIAIVCKKLLFEKHSSDAPKQLSSLVGSTISRLIDKRCPMSQARSCPSQASQIGPSMFHMPILLYQGQSQPGAIDRIHEP